MCRRVSCASCGKPTFAGCGAHVEQVLRDVPAAERCKCHEAGAKKSSAAQEERPSWLRSLMGKGGG